MARIKAPARRAPVKRQGKRHAAPKKKPARRAVAPAASTPPAPVRTLTRGAVAKRLGISIASVRRREASGELKPSTDANGVRLFREDEIEALGNLKPAAVRIDAGERAARAWEALAKGATIFDLVTTLRMHPDDAAKLARDFSAPGILVLPASTVAQLAALGFGDSSGRVSAATLVAAATSLRTRLRELRQAVAPEKKEGEQSALPPAPLSSADRAAPKEAAATRPAPSVPSRRDRSPRARASR
jgi:hypothetical protein